MRYANIGLDDTPRTSSIISRPVINEIFEQMELFIKIVIIIVATLAYAKLVHWTCTSHIDPKATLQKYIKKTPEIAEVVVTREPNKIYQNGSSVGDVTGTVETKDNKVLFSEIINTSSLNRDEPFEYQRMRLTIMKINEMIGLKFDGPVTKTAVLRNVECKIVSD